MKKLSTLLTFFLCTLFVPALQAPAEEMRDFVVIVNKQNIISSVPLRFIKRIYLKELTNWSGSLQIIPVDQDEGSPIRSDFSSKVIGKSPEEMRIYWINQKVSDNKSAPLVVKDSQVVKKFVSENKGAIGYIRRSEADDSVKVLDILN